MRSPTLLLVILLVAAPAAARAQDTGPPAIDWARWWQELSSPRQPATEEKLSLADPATGEPNHLLAGFVSGGVLLGSALNSFTETPHQSFHVTHEGFFDRDTYAGGADKVSHFVDYHFVSKELATFYQVLGYQRGQSILMGAAVSSVAGLVTELGDGTSFFGFSYEDLLMDFGGAWTAALIAATRTEDLFGFRRGFIPNGDSGSGCCARSGKGRDYSNEIYTADLKLAGVARRSGLALGPLRYLMVSVTYGTSGYPNAPADRQQRLVGFELGLNLEEILNDLGVRRNTWWGYALHVVLDNMRVPFTSIGARYDLNHGTWRGPGP
jgi:hypothetical protein